MEVQSQWISAYLADTMGPALNLMQPRPVTFGGVITTETWSVGIYRNSITVGGQVGLSFLKKIRR